MRKAGIVLIIVILIALGVVALKNNDDGADTVVLQEGQPLSDEQIRDIVEMVSRHMKLPDELPNVGVVTDIELLRSTQPFYEGAENGDVLLLYPSISRAILYDLDEDVIINVGPVVFENPEGGPSAE